MSTTQKIDAFQRRHPVAGFPLAVIYKFYDDQGNYLAAVITYYGIIALFPLLLLLTTILGFVLADDPELQQRVVDSAVGEFPVIGEDLRRPGEIGGGTTGLVFGILGSIYGGVGVAQALQNATSIAWAIPRNSRPNPLKSRGRSLLLLATVGLGVFGTTAVTALGTSAGTFGRSIGFDLSGLVMVASVLVNAAVITLAFRIATARQVRIRDLVPGALTGAIAWQFLQSFGALYVGDVVQDASATNAAFALVLGLIAFVYLTAVAMVLSIELNVVRTKKLYPRALLTPFTDRVDLTRGDRLSYAAQAKAQRNKGFQDIDVTFGPRPGGDEEAPR